MIARRGPVKAAVRLQAPVGRNAKRDAAGGLRMARPAPRTQVGRLVPALGAVIRQARKQGHLTLLQLAASTRLSISYLSQIERNLLTPSVSTLKVIADSLGIPAGTLMFSQQSRNPGPLAVVMRKGKRKRLSLPESSIVYELLTPDLRRRSSVLWLVAEPGAKSGNAITHEGEDVVVVLKGKLRIHAGGVWHTLARGDSMFFNSELPHHWENAGSTTAEAIWVSAPPSF